MLGSEKVLFVASAGGHLAELHQLRDRIVHPNTKVSWLTTDHKHSRSLLEGEDVYYVPSAPSRDIVAAARNAWQSLGFIKTVKPTWVISNGASLAVSVLPLARLFGIRASYLENSVHVVGPSLSGRIVSAIPGIETYAQQKGWAPRWRYVGSVLDTWTAVPESNTKRMKRIVVTVGTAEWPFVRLFKRLTEILPPNVDVLWQVGSTSVLELGIDGVRDLSENQLREAILDADVVVAHAGIGSAMMCFECGKLPVLIPRRSECGEAVDNHQRDIALELSNRGLCVYSEAGELSFEVITKSQNHRIMRNENLPAIVFN